MSGSEGYASWGLQEDLGGLLIHEWRSMSAATAKKLTGRNLSFEMRSTPPISLGVVREIITILET